MSISVLLGKTLIKVENNGNSLIFTANTLERWEMSHSQDCCECVDLEDVCGDLSDLIGSPITMAEEDSNYEGEDRGDESYTWTFYKLATNKGYVTLRWYGSSNGYYSESVDFYEIERAPTKLEYALK